MLKEKYMANTGKELEDLVNTIERVRSPLGFEGKKREKIYDS